MTGERLSLRHSMKFVRTSSSASILSAGSVKGLHSRFSNVQDTIFCSSAASSGTVNRYLSLGACSRAGASSFSSCLASLAYMVASLSRNLCATGSRPPYR